MYVTDRKRLKSKVKNDGVAVAAAPGTSPGVSMSKSGSSSRSRPNHNSRPVPEVLSTTTGKPTQPIPVLEELTLRLRGKVSNQKGQRQRGLDFVEFPIKAATGCKKQHPGSGYGCISSSSRPVTPIYARKVNLTKKTRLPPDDTVDKLRPQKTPIYKCNPSTSASVASGSSSAVQTQTQHNKVAQRPVKCPSNVKIQGSSLSQRILLAKSHLKKTKTNPVAVNNNNHSRLPQKNTVIKSVIPKPVEAEVEVESENEENFHKYGKHLVSQCVDESKCKIIPVIPIDRKKHLRDNNAQVEALVRGKLQLISNSIKDVSSEDEDESCGKDLFSQRVLQAKSFLKKPNVKIQADLVHDQANWNYKLQVRPHTYNERLHSSPALTSAENNNDQGVQTVGKLIQMFNNHSATSITSNNHNLNRKNMGRIIEDKPTVEVDWTESKLWNQENDTNFTSSSSNPQSSGKPDSPVRSIIDRSSLVRASQLKDIIGPRGSVLGQSFMNNQANISAVTEDGFQSEDASLITSAQESVTNGSTLHGAARLPKPRWITSMENLSAVPTSIRTVWNSVNVHLRNKFGDGTKLKRVVPQDKTAQSGTIATQKKPDTDNTK